MNLKFLHRLSMSGRGFDRDKYGRFKPEVAQILLEKCKAKFKLGTLARGRAILRIIAGSTTSKGLTAAYFENLENLLKCRSRLAVPGTIAFGLGSGRCGSTSLAALFASVCGSCTTHENPPLIYWVPAPDQLQFHLRRFKVLSDYFILTFDAAHWWLNAFEFFVNQLPDVKAIGLYRNVETCAQSFMTVKRYGRGSLNNWVPVPNGIWRATPWDPTYPTYDIPPSAVQYPDAAKLELIRRYIEEYNAQQNALAGRYPTKMLLVRTEDLDRDHHQASLFQFIGCPGEAWKITLNAGTVSDGESDSFKF